MALKTAVTSPLLWRLTPTSRPDLRKDFSFFIREHYGFVVKALDSSAKSGMVINPPNIRAGSQRQLPPLLAVARNTRQIVLQP